MKNSHSPTIKLLTRITDPKTDQLPTKCITLANAIFFIIFFFTKWLQWVGVIL